VLLQQGVPAAPLASVTVRAGETTHITFRKP
jgi:hypothetical protein